MESEVIYKTLFNSAPDAMFLSDAEGKIVMANHQVRKIFGFNKEEIIGRKLDSVIHAQISVDNKNSIPLSKNGSSLETLLTKNDLKAIRKDGSEIFIEISSNSIKIKNEKYISTAIRDITKKRINKKHLERSIQIIKNQYQELKKFSELEQFVFLASHFLREPLQLILACSELIEKHKNEWMEDPGTESIGYIKNAANRMDHLIAGLLHYSRLGQDRNIEQVDCNQIIREVINDLNPLILASNAEINTMDLPMIEGYGKEIKILFTNLIENGIKFRKKNSHPIIDINTEKNNVNWKLSISDNGIGVKKNGQEKMFNLFQRLETGIEGLGIGLAYCKKIVNLHNGKIRVKSIENQGTTFYITIPKY